MRVVLLGTDLERGGTPLRLARLAVGLRDLGADVHVGCLAKSGPVSSDLEKQGVPTFACDACCAYDLLTFRRLAKHLRRIRPDIIHSTLTHANVAARLVGRWLHIPVVSSTATIEVERRSHLRLERWTAGCDRGHIVNSAVVAEHVIRNFQIPAEKVHVVPPSIDFPRERLDSAEARRRFRIPEAAFVILWAGRFDPVKRIDLTIRCLEHLADLDAHLLLAGDGPSRSTIQTRIDTSAARDRIHCVDWQDDLGPVMSAADVLLFPSLTEGMPNVVMQAMAFGLPVIGSDIPALRELSGDEKRLMLAESNDVEAFAALLRICRDQPAHRRAASEKTAAWARNAFRPEAAAHRILEIYRMAVE